VAWSKRTGLLASVGADGRIVIYQEQFADRTTSTCPQGKFPSGQDAIDLSGNNNDTSSRQDADAMEIEATTAAVVPNRTASAIPGTEWRVLATVDAAHGIYEINHVCWAKQADRNKRTGSETQGDKEVLLTTGDDGCVKVWSLQVE
jgi:hypothetical protein